MFHHILVPTDGSQLSARAVAIAIELAKASEARLTALNVVPLLPTAGHMQGMPADYSPERINRAAERASRELLERISAMAAEAGVQCDALTDDQAAPWRSIIDTASSRGCDLIVMATHGRRGFEAVLLGSETHKVLTHSSTPVLVCR
jgi:nucleotide-binding universal stress UspA family protein